MILLKVIQITKYYEKTIEVTQYKLFGKFLIYQIEKTY